MLGVRLTFNTPATLKWLDDGTADWFWPAAEERAAGHVPRVRQCESFRVHRAAPSRTAAHHRPHGREYRDREGRQDGGENRRRRGAREVPRSEERRVGKECRSRWS